MKEILSPSEILMRAMAKLKINKSTLANDLGVSRGCISNLIHERRKLSKEMALRLSVYFCTKPESWLIHQLSKEFNEVSEKYIIPTYSKKINTDRYKNEMSKLRLGNQVRKWLGE